MNKKGQISSLTGIVSSLIIIAIFIVAGLVIVQEFYEQDELADTQATVINETIAYINETGYTLLESSASGFNSVRIIVAYNDTSGNSGVGGYNWTIPSGNYSVSSAGVVTNATTEIYYNVSISYTFQYGEGAYSGMEDTLTAVRQIPTTLGLVILIVMIGIILALVFNVIPGARVSGA